MPENMASDIIPDQNSAYTIGSSTKKLKHVYSNNARGLHQVNTGDTTRGAIWTALEALEWDVDTMHIGTHDGNGDGQAEFVSVYKYQSAGLNRYKIQNTLNNWLADCGPGGTEPFLGRLWVM
jgi:hypothetical protein